MTYDVTLIPGDGIGPEITAQTVHVLEATGLRFNWDEELAGMAAVEATGTPLPDATVESIRKNAARPQGPAHHAGRHRLPLGQRRAAQGVRALRQRPPRPHHRARRPVRERGHRAGAGEPRGTLHRGRALRADRRRSRARWPSRWRSSPARGCERIIRYAFEYALKHGRKKVTIVHKANILKMVSGLFLEVGRGDRQGVRGPGGVQRHDRGQHRHAAGDAARAVRRDGDHQHVRRHPERRGLRPGRRPGPRAGRQHRHQGGDLRGGARQRARHRGARASPIPRPRCSPPR